MLGLPLEIIKQGIAEVELAMEYSNGLALFTAWQWDEAELNDGD